MVSPSPFNSWFYNAFFSSMFFKWEILGPRSRSDQPDLGLPWMISFDLPGNLVRYRISIFQMRKSRQSCHIQRYWTESRFKGRQFGLRAWVRNIKNTAVDERLCLAQSFLGHVTLHFVIKPPAIAGGGWWLAQPWGVAHFHLCTISTSELLLIRLSPWEILSSVQPRGEAGSIWGTVSSCDPFIPVIGLQCLKCLRQ